jgi:hypothetical protein
MATRTSNIPCFPSKRRGPHDGPDHHEAASPRPLTLLVPDSLEAKRAALKNPSNEGVLDGPERRATGSRRGRPPERRTGRVSPPRGRGQTEDADQPGTIGFVPPSACPPSGARSGDGRSFRPKSLIRFECEPTDLRDRALPGHGCSAHHCIHASRLRRDVSQRWRCKRGGSHHRRSAPWVAAYQLAGRARIWVRIGVLVATSVVGYFAFAFLALVPFWFPHCAH